MVTSATVGSGRFGGIRPSARITLDALSPDSEQRLFLMAQYAPEMHGRIVHWAADLMGRPRRAAVLYQQERRPDLKLAAELALVASGVQARRRELRAWCTTNGTRMPIGEDDELVMMVIELATVQRLAAVAAFDRAYRTADLIRRGRGALRRRAPRSRVVRWLVPLATAPPGRDSDVVSPLRGLLAPPAVPGKDERNQGPLRILCRSCSPPRSPESAIGLKHRQQDTTRR